MWLCYQPQQRSFLVQLHQVRCQECSSSGLRRRSVQDVRVLLPCRKRACTACNSGQPGNVAEHKNASYWFSLLCACFYYQCTNWHCLVRPGFPHYISCNSWNNAASSQNQGSITHCVLSACRCRGWDFKCPRPSITTGTESVTPVTAWQGQPLSCCKTSGCTRNIVANMRS